MAAWLSAVAVLVSAPLALPSTARAGINEWTSGGPGGISTAALAVSPNFGSDRTIFAGTYGNYGVGGQGVFRSQDGGQSWSPVNHGLTDLRVNALAVSPAYPMDGTVFAGSNGGGVYKSVNGGETWSQVNTGLTWLDVASLAVSPAYAADGTVFAGTGSGRLFRSVTRGQSWVPVGPGFNEVYSIAVAANGTVFASNYGGGVSRSDDLGGTWVALGAPNNDDFISDVAVSPDYGSDHTVYAGGSTLHKSTDGGVTWVTANNGGSYYNPTPGGLNIAYVGGMVISPNYASDRSLFVGGHGVFRSRDAGATWTQIDRGLSAYVPALGISANFGADSTLFAGTTESTQGQGGGVFSYTIDDTFPADDWDRDGYAYDAGDCNDTNLAVNPGVTEVPDNGVDDNCNGSVDEQSLGWTSKAGLPIVVDFTTSVAVNGSLYLLGGNVVGNWAPGPVQKYDPLLNVWSVASSSDPLQDPPLGPLTGSGAGSAAAGSIIYVFGGQTASGPGGEIVAFDTVSGTSSQVGVMTKPRGWTNGAVIGNTLYIVGGDNPTGDPALQTDNTIEAFDLANHMSTQVAFMAEPRSDAGVAAAGSRLYIFGGLSCGPTGCTGMDTSLGYDTSTGGFFGVSSLPFPAATRVAGQLNGTVYVVTTQMGGVGDNRLLAYDIATDSWSEVSQVPTSRDFPAVALLDGTVYVIGGYDRVLSAHSGRNEAYTVGTGWSISSYNGVYSELIDWPLSQHGPLASGNYVSVAGTYYYVIGGGTGSWSGPDFAVAPLQQCDQYTGAPLVDPGTGSPLYANMSGMTGQPLTLYVTWPGGGGGDTIPPYGTIHIAGGATYTNSGLVSLALTCDDNGGSGCNQMQFSNDGSSWSSPESFSAFKTWALSSGDGVKSVYVKYSDNAGHWSGFFGDSINLDTTAPSGAVSINSGAVYASAAAVTLALTCSDAGSSCSEMQLSNDGTTWSTLSFAPYKSWTLLPGDGVKTVFARFKDGAGYWSSSVPDSITLDTTAPTGSVLINGGAALTTSPVVGLSLFAADNLSGVDKVRYGYYELGAWEPMSAAKTLNLGNEGTKTVSVQFMDKAGLVSALATATIDYYVTPPGITTASLSSGTIGSSYSQTIATDNKGKPTFTWTVEEGSLPAGLAIVPTGYTYSAQISGRPLVAGTSTFTIRVTDAVGHTGTKTFSLEIAPFEEWRRTIVTPVPEWPTRSAVDDAGNVYVTGHTKVNSDDAVLLVKHDNFGNLIWTKTFGVGPNRGARGSDVAVDGDGNVYVAGYGWNNATGHFSDDYLTLKYSAAGDLLWSRFHGGTGQDYGCAVAVAPGGIVYVTGQVYSYGSSTFDSTIVAYDAAGNDRGAWTYDYQVNGSSVNNFGNDIAAAADGNLYELERWSGGPSWHYLVVKYQRDAAGALSRVWATPYDGGYDTPAAIAVDPAGNVVIAGESHAQWATAKYLTAKFDPSGALLWSRSYGYYYTSGTYGTYLDSVATDVGTDADGAVYVTGRSKVTDDNVDIVTKKYDAQGNEVWTKITTGPGTNHYTATGVAVDASGGVFVSGYTYPQTGGNGDLVVLKYGQSLQLQILGDALADGSFGVPYSDFLRVTGGPQPYVWSLAGGSLPDGLALNTATGEVSGTPQGTGSYSIDVRVTDALSGAVTETVSLVIPNPMTITTNSLADGTVGLAYYQDVLSAIGGTSPHTWSLAGGSLPAGMSLSVAGVISGTPTAAGTSSFTVQASDSATLRATKVLSITVNKGTPILTWADPADVVYPTGLSAAQLNATANVPGTFVYSPGFSALLNVGTGHLLSVQFTPTDTANYTGATAAVHLNVLMGAQTITFAPITDRPFGPDFTVVARNSSYLTPSFAAAGNCTVALDSTDQETAVATVHMGGGGTCTVTASQGGNNNYYPAPDVARSFTIFKLTPTIAWSNPAGIVYGMALGAAQLNAIADVPGTFAYWPVAGTVLTPGDQSLSVVFTPNEGGIYDGVSKSAALVVTSSFAVATASPLTAGFVGAPYRETLAASGGVGTYSWQLASGSSLPAGLSLGANGTIGGTPTAAVTRNFTVQVTDENNIGAAKEISLTINPARPDLISTVVSGPVAGTRGKSINVSATVRNQGQAKAGSFTMTFYLSADADITVADVELGSKALKSLGINGSATVNGNFLVPKSMASGRYFVGVLVDSAGTVAETNESNNPRGGTAIEIR